MTMTTYDLHVPTGASARSNRASHVCHTITSPEQLASLLPRKLAKNAEAIHGHILTCLEAGRESVTIQASPYFSASPLKCRKCGEPLPEGFTTRCPECASE